MNGDAHMIFKLEGQAMHVLVSHTPRPCDKDEVSLWSLDNDERHKCDVRVVGPDFMGCGGTSKIPGFDLQ